MKKRFLSAVLALAMVLTLLPMSVLSASAAGAWSDGDSATYYNAENNTVKGSDWNGPGWYAKHDTKDASGKVTQTEYIKITSGFVVGGKAYTGMIDDKGKLRSASFTAIGNQTVAVPDDVTTITADVYGGYSDEIGGNSLNTSLTITTNSSTKLTGVTVRDTYYAAEVNAGRREATQRAAVTLPTSWAANKTISITLSDVTSNSTPVLQNVSAVTGSNLPVPLTNSVTLTNASIGKLTMGASSCADKDGKPVYTAQNITANKSSVYGAPGNSIEGITVVGNNSRINLTDTALGANAVSITGTGATLTVSGDTVGTGDVTLIGSTSDKITTGTAPSVTVNGTSLGAIKGSNSEELTTNFGVTVNGAGTVASIDIENANVTVNGGTVTGAIEVTNGFVKIQNGATVDDITFGADGIITEFSVTGSRNTVGAVTSTGTFKLVNIVADDTNTFESVDLGDYAGHGIHGGKFETPIDTDDENAYLDTAMSYLVKLSASAPTQYYQYFPGTSEGLSQAIAAAGKTNATGTNGIVLKGQTGTGLKSITLQNEGTVLAKIYYKVSSGVVMPSVVNGVTYDSWTVTDAKGDSGASYKPGQTFTATDVKDYILDAQVSAGSISKINNVTVSGSGENANVTAKLVGNTITLSGAAESTAGGIAVFKVKLDTDLTNKDGAIKPEIGISWDGKKATFDRNSNPGYGITFPDENTMRLENGTTYTVSGSGLRELVTTFTTDADAKLDVVVTAPGYTTDNQKANLITRLVGNNNGTTASFTFSSNSAMNQAVNAVMATITDSQVKSWATQAQRQAWKVNSNLNPTEADLAGTGYTQVYLVPFLRATITNANPLTVNFAPYYRVEVRNTDTNKDPIVVKTATAMGALAADLTNGTGVAANGVQVKLAISETYAHQDSTYVYAAQTGTFNFLHAGKTGLGTVVFNNTAPAITLTRQKDAKNADGSTVAALVTYTYDSLQAAVDDTLPQAKDKLDKIEITNGYQGNGAISVSGLSRTFEIDSKGNTTISASASADVKVTTPDVGNTYTVQLLKDYVTTATIIVESVDNGTAAITTNNINAKPGEKVTITLNPKAGYQGSITAKTNSGAEVPVTNNGDNTFTFTVPSGATRVDVTPVFLPASLLPFTDVKTTDSFYNAVLYCYDHNLINGTTLTTFAPYNTITRAQIVTILWRQAGGQTYARQGIYKDMPANNDYYNAIIWATKTGVAKGYEDGKFYPNRSINRQELATFLYRYQTLVLKRAANGSVANLNGYTDGYRTETWAQPAMRWAVGNGIVTGTGSSLTPRYDAPRYQAATAMYQYMSGVLGIK